MNFRQYDEETLKHLHDLELMILKDFIKICEENNLNYYMYAGSLLGTIRHKGFIPWDDDLDVIMFREDFEKFKLARKRLVFEELLTLQIGLLGLKFKNR